VTELVWLRRNVEKFGGYFEAAMKLLNRIIEKVCGRTQLVSLNLIDHLLGNEVCSCCSRMLGSTFLTFGDEYSCTYRSASMKRSASPICSRL
jgi:hypothetical protein